MSESGGKNEPLKEERERTSPPLYEILKESAFRSDRAIDSTVNSIDVSFFSTDIDQVLEASKADDLNREYGKLIWVTNDKKVQIQTKVQRGEYAADGTASQAISVDSQSITPTADPRISSTWPWYMKQNRMIATILHSHGLHNIPASPQDLIPILLRNQSPMAGACTFVVTPDTKMLIFRSNETPEFPLPEINKSMSKLFLALQNRIRSHESPHQSTEEHLSLNARVIAALQRDLAKKYKLNLFFGDGAELELKKINPDDLPSLFRDLPQRGSLPSKNP